jgi:RNA polymerase sigma-70 factor (ECF subfamily)
VHTGEERHVQEPEPALIRAAAAGNQEAFEQIVREQQVHVWRFLRRLLGDPALAEDVTQETFVRIYTRLDSFTFQAKFTTWMLQIARNAGIDALRGRERRARLAAAVESRHPRPDISPDQRAELQAALDSLPVDLRTILLLVEVLGLRYGEAAAVLDLPVGTVRSRVFRARRRLHEWGAVGEPAEGRDVDEV